MYKVFFNDRKIVFAPPCIVTLNQPVHFLDKLSSSEARNIFMQFVESKNDELYLIHPDPEKILKIFQTVFKTIKAAGGLVIRNQKLLFILRKGKWDLPKGKLDKGETVREAAIREVHEECGISGHEISKKLPSTYHIYQSIQPDSGDEWIFKTTFWFEMHYSGKNNGSPQIDEGISKLVWISKDELNKMISNTYANLMEIIQFYLD